MSTQNSILNGKADDLLGEFTPFRDLVKEYGLRVRRTGNFIIEVIIPVEGDHPMLLTIDLADKTFDVQGYD